MLLPELSRDQPTQAREHQCLAPLAHNSGDKTNRYPYRESDASGGVANHSLQCVHTLFLLLERILYISKNILLGPFITVTKIAQNSPLCLWNYMQFYDVVIMIRELWKADMTRKY